ncbi:MAG: hypothetical protein K9G67_02215 [Bacteroidales bacterium]|nr:hypothetical protein [Bacteroidales bacterium]MCF8343863.1 hypothetical protein [Bacteroidales bacterium]MCF8351748.1 hypothetical protein [Bacteroidales bacterium]MCF8375146.1 hypothetical protein [Bacteroidales bacterium]MCF8400053.1 hypothetical protein [Bacteroidales bacterium]
MKKSILAFVFAIVMMAGFSQSDKYLQSMKAGIEEISETETHTDMLALANRFERIAGAENDQWLPWYYAAYCNTLACFMGMDISKVDQQLEKAQAALDKARELEEENDEIEVMQGFIYQAGIIVDPQSRGYSYSTKSNTAFTKAKSINPDNPRVYFLEAQNLLNTPAAYGGGPAVACPKYKLAAEKFATFKPESKIAPAWGEEMNEGMMEQNCK